MKRTEAGAFFALGQKPHETIVTASPWRITVTDGFTEDIVPEGETVETHAALTEQETDSLRAALQFRYAHIPATQTPSKQTATQRKGRIKDQEAAEEAQPPKSGAVTWRQPSFRDTSRSGTAYGSAIHAVLQYIRYEACTDVTAVSAEIARLGREGYITPEQARIADSRSIASFFATPLGVKLRSGGQVLREFKFSILDDASCYGSDLQGEQVLLQGVVDCALLEPDGITVVDFKTDYLTPKTVDAVTARYAPQVQTYADALARIYQMHVKAKALYYFHTGSFVWL
jgi:ATP-dependent helicase/nuclease subunit A